MDVKKRENTKFWNQKEIQEKNQRFQLLFKIQEAISKLTALDGFSFNAILNNSFIRCLKKVMFFQKITCKQSSYLKAAAVATEKVENFGFRIGDSIVCSITN